MNDFLIVIDANSSSTTGLAGFWQESGFAARVGRLGFKAFLLDPQGHVPDSPFQRVDSFTGAVSQLAPNQALIHIFADQVFLDEDVVLNAVAKFNQARPDMFTQWEHCRLPVGVGVRILSQSALTKTAADSIEGFLSQVRAKPGDFNVRYDEHVYVAVDAARLDARARPELGVSGSADAQDWSLAGFLDFAKEAPAGLRYAPAEPPAPMTDERGMPAPYGFESIAGDDFPTYIMFDLTNRCNAACIHCPQSVGFSGQETDVFLPLETFKSVVDEAIGREIDFVRITADGEPMLHPDLWEMLSYAQEKEVGPVGLTTNGSALNEKNARRLIESGAFMIDISIDAYTAPTFELVRAGLSFERTIGNVETLLRLRDELGSPIKVMVSFVKQKENADEVDDFVKFWEGKVDQVLVREMISNVGLIDVTGSSVNAPVDRWPCPHWWRRVVINYDGVLKACPIDWQGELTNRAISEETVLDQWHGDFYHDYRMQHLNNDHKADSACKDCRDWRGTPWMLGYEKVVRSLAETE